jgi:hypothetical protein
MPTKIVDIPESLDSKLYLYGVAVASSGYLFGGRCGKRPYCGAVASARTGPAVAGPIIRVIRGLLKHQAAPAAALWQAPVQAHAYLMNRIQNKYVIDENVINCGFSAYLRVFSRVNINNIYS